MSDDYYRATAYGAVTEFLTENRTNAIATEHVWRAVNTALDAYDDEFARSALTFIGWVIMLGVQPMLVVPTKRIAKQQLKLMRRTVGEGSWRIARTQYTLKEG